MSNPCSRLPVRFTASATSLCVAASVICCGARRVGSYALWPSSTPLGGLLMCTDTSLSAVEIIRLYGLRFKMECSFKQAVHQIGSFAYHFWMKDMIPLRSRNGDQYLHRKSDDYRNRVKRKMRAYHTFIQAGVVAQGLLQYLAVAAPKLVWDTFGSWLRTIRPGIPPSEFVVANALRQTLPEF